MTPELSLWVQNLLFLIILIVTVIVVMGWGYVFTDANGLFVLPTDDTQVNMKQQWNDVDRAESKVSEKNLSQLHSARHMDDRGFHEV